MTKLLDFRVTVICASRNTKEKSIGVKLTVHVEVACDSKLVGEKLTCEFDFVSKDGLQGTGKLGSFCSPEMAHWFNENTGARDKMKDQLLDIAADYEAVVEKLAEAAEAAIGDWRALPKLPPEHIGATFRDDNPTKYSVMEEVSHTIQSTHTTAISTGADA